jgi:tRNA pseudouridine38-40 synthase
MGTVLYKVVLSYDGTAFSGMQRQANRRSVQAEVETALRQLGWQGRSITVAGRTDAGVHASGQVIAFQLEWKHSADKLGDALNANLPEDLAANKVVEAPAGFHPRFDAKRRTYRYRLFCQPKRDPLRERYAWRLWPPVKLSALRTAARSLKGEHDFTAFGTPPNQGGSTVRKVMRANWAKKSEDEYVFEVTANAFLYHMVRRMVGLQVKIGQGLAKPDAIQRALDGKAGRVRELAPAQGLCLVAVEY